MAGVQNAPAAAPGCKRTIQLRQSGTLIRHKIGTERCIGSEGQPGELVSLASWLPLRPGLTPHGLRHGHQTWLDDLGIRYVLQSERMGHEVPGIRGARAHHTANARRTLGRSARAMGRALVILGM
jgi:integrase